MYSWLLPAVKAILPHVGSIIDAALPAFKSRKVDENVATQDALLQQQITELQEVASHNAVHIKDLAEQLKKMVLTLEQDALAQQRRYQRLAILSWTALALALLAIGLWCLGAN